MVSGTSNLLSLNDDTLSSIVSYLASRDALNLAATTRALYHLEYLKQQAVIAVSMHSIEQIKRTCTFLAADIPRRAQKVREMTVVMRSVAASSEYGASPQRHILQLAHLLEHTARLKSLTLSLHDLVSQKSPSSILYPVFSAISSLSCLLDIDLRHVSKKQALEQLPSQLQTVTLDLSREGSPTWDSLICSMSHLRALRELEITYCGRLLSRGHMRYPNESSDKDRDSTCIPAVRELRLMISDIPISVIVKAFPNVRALTVQGSPRNPAATPQLQAVHWRRLDYLEGEPVYFRHWTFKCSVHRISFASLSILGLPDREYPTLIGSTGFNDIAETLRTAEETRPMAIDFSIMGGPADLIDIFWKRLIAVAPKLRCLEFELCTFSDMADSLDKIAERVRSVSSILTPISTLKYVGVCANTHLTHWESPGTARAKAPGVDLDEETSQEVSREIASLIVKRIPSLHLIAFGFGKRSEKSSRHLLPFDGRLWWWRAVGHAEKRCVRPISSYDLGLILRNRMMIVGDSDDRKYAY